MPTTSAAWLFADDHQGFLPCAQYVSDALEAHLASRLSNPLTVPTHLTLTIDGTLYSFDVILWEQQNHSSKRVRALRRFTAAPTIRYDVRPASGATVAGAGTLPSLKKSVCGYVVACLEFLRLRSTAAALHPVDAGKMKLRLTHDLTDLSSTTTGTGAAVEVVVDAIALTAAAVSYGGLVTRTVAFDRVLQAVDEEDDDDTVRGGTTAKSATASGGRRRPRSSDDDMVPTSIASPEGVDATMPPVAPNMRGAPAPSSTAAEADIPATLLDDSPLSSPVKLRGPGHSSTTASTTTTSAPVVITSTPATSPFGGPADVPLRRLLFPSFSTAVFMFDLTTAATIATKIIASFLAKHPQPWIRLCLIDAPYGPDTPTITAFKNAWNSLGVPDPRLEFRTADITVASERGPCFCIANASNESFNGGPSTGGFNRALYIAAGDKELQADTRAKYPKGGSVGPCYDVALRVSSPLYADGVRHVLHVIGPNMNPTRPHCLYGDYKTGSSLLATCYENLLETFVKLATPA